MAYSDSFGLILSEFSRSPLARNLRDATDTLALVGLYHAAKVALRILYNTCVGVKTYLISRFYSNEKWLKSLGNWAVVTGSSRGIGLAYAKELAKRRFNLILIAKEADVLDKIATSLATKYQVDVIKVPCDFTDQESFVQVEKAIIGRDIGILVNCAGAISGPEYFHLTSKKSINDQLFVNTFALAQVIRMILPAMVQKNKGAIVNCSSISTHLPIPYYSVYGATKSFVEKLTDSLRWEYSHTKLVFQCLSPFVVKTKMTMDMDYDGIKGARVDALSYSKSAIRTLGFSNHTCGHWLHGIQYYFMKSIPSPIFNWFYAKIFQIMFRSYKKKYTSGGHLRRDYDDVDLILNDEP